jgi:Ca2+-binding EF-hand superfamily protein
MAFSEIDDWNYGYIDAKNLKNFLRKHGYLASEADIMAIIRRMDLDGDARIGKEEFIQSLMPE